MNKQYLPSIVQPFLVVTMGVLLPSAALHAQPQTTVKGPIKGIFNPITPTTFFITKTTRLVPATDPDLITELKDNGFTATSEGFARTLIRGQQWVVSKKGYQTLKQDKSIFAKITGTHYSLSDLTKFTWQQPVGNDGRWIDQVWVGPVTKLKRDYTGRQVQVQTGEDWISDPTGNGGPPWPVPVYGWVDEYIDREIIVKPKVLVNKVNTDSIVPRAPFTIPSKIDVGTSLKFNLYAAPNAPVKWNVTRLYRQGNSTFAEGKLSSINSLIAVVSGTMVLRTDTGIVEQLKSTTVYPKGELFGKSFGSWKFKMDFARVSQPQYEQTSNSEWKRYAGMSTMSSIWNKDIAAERVVGRRWTIKRTNWAVRFLSKQTFSATRDGKSMVTGTWQIANRSIRMRPKNSQSTGIFAFSLATSNLEAMGEKSSTQFLEDAN